MAGARLITTLFRFATRRRWDLNSTAPLPTSHHSETQYNPPMSGRQILMLAIGFSRESA